jgi:hypothetical protein
LRISIGAAQLADLAFQLGDALLLNGGHTGPLAGLTSAWRTQLRSASR